MSPAAIFQIHLILGYVPWLLCFGAYVWPRLKAMDRIEAQRAIATLHSFRFFGLVFIIPGVVGPNLPTAFAAFAAYGDFATGLLAMLALLTVRIRSVFWPLVVAFNLVGAVDIIVDYYHGNQVGLPALAGELGATHAVPLIYVPLLIVTHVPAFYLLRCHLSPAAPTLPARVRVGRCQFLIGVRGFVGRERLSCQPGADALGVAGDGLHLGADPVSDDRLGRVRNAGGLSYRARGGRRSRNTGGAAFRL